MASSGSGSTPTGPVKISRGRFESKDYLIKPGNSDAIKAIVICNWKEFRSVDNEIMGDDERLQKDAKLIVDTIKEKFGITNVDSIENKSKRELEDELKRIAGTMGKPDLLLCFIIGRGKCDFIYECSPNKAEKINLKDICKIFNGDQCRALVLRPKLFFAQIEWEGPKLRPGQHADDGDKSKFKTVPVESDFFVYCSHKLNDSTFTELLCEELHGDVDVLDLTLRVNNRIFEQRKDIPVCTCRLTRNVILPPKAAR